MRCRQAVALICILFLGACGRPSRATNLDAGSIALGHLRQLESMATTTSTIPPPPPTTVAPHRAPTAAARTGTRPMVAVVDAAFWRRLANCESRDGRSGAYMGFFQFTWANAARLGVGPSSSYEAQRDAAIRWLAIIGGRGGTTAGWPVCWWVALRG